MWDSLPKLGQSVVLKRLQRFISNHHQLSRKILKSAFKLCIFMFVFYCILGIELKKKVLLC
jgi:hypothetical protein